MVNEYFGGYMSLKQEIEEKLQELSSYERTLMDLSKEMLQADDGNMFPLDMLAIGVVNRSLSLVDGFITLIKGNNYIAASNLVRPHLDNYLRFYAAWLVPEPHEFVMKVLEGERIDKLKDRKGKPLNDRYLVQEASKEHPWMERVYKESSGFVHLSKKHVFTSSTLLSKEERTIGWRIGKEDKFVPDEARVEALSCMIEITDCIIQLIEGWIWSKSNPDALKELREDRDKHK